MEAIQPCPSGLQMCNPIDIPNLQDLNMDCTPTANPLAKPFKLKLNNRVRFSHDIKAPPLKFDYSSQPKFFVDIPIDSCFIMMVELSQEAPDFKNIPTKEQPSISISISISIILSIITPEDFAASIAISTDKLFFTRYLMADTCWSQ